MRRHRLALALAVVSTLGASSLTNGSLNALTGSTDQRTGDAALETLALAELGATGALAQLGATAVSTDSFSPDMEAGHTNWLKLDESFLAGGSASDFTAGQPDDLVHAIYAGSIGLGDDAYTNFGFCTDGGPSVGGFGNCAYDDTSLSGALDYGTTGLVSSALADFDSFGFASTQNDVLWASFMSTDPLIFMPSSSTGGSFVGNSGMPNDYTQVDYGAIENRDPVAVPEPATISLLGIGLLGLAAARRWRASK